MAVIGWPALVLVMVGTRPTIGPRWLFFFTWTLAMTGTALPFVWFLQRRFGGRRPPTASVLLRRALGVGLYAALLAWLQVNRSLDLSLAVLLAVGLLSFEWILGVLQQAPTRSRR